MRISQTKANKMGTSGSLGRSIQGASDEIFDYTCATCTKKNRNREATKYCINCQDYYCSTCVQIHADVPFMEGHKIVGRAKFPTNLPRSLVSMPTERCPLHPTKLLDMFCQNDDEIGCTVCMAVKHRSCIDVVYIPEEIDNIYNKGDITRLKTDLTKVKHSLKDFVQSRQNDIEQVNKNRAVVLVKIKNFRQKVNTTLDQLEKATINEFESNIKVFTDKINKPMEAMNTALKDIESCQQHLESAEKNQSQQFVCLKKGQQKLFETEKIRKDEEKSSQIANIEFEEDSKIEVFLNKLNTLGKLIEKSDSNLHQVTKQSTPYKVTNTNSYNVKISGDICDNIIFGSCIMTSGNILLTEWNNGKLKQLHGTTYKVIDQCDLPAGPSEVCEIGPQEAAVILHTDTIQVVSVGSKMTLTRTIQMNHECNGLAFSRGEMFVSGRDKDVYVYDTSGTLLRTISKDQSGGDIFSACRHIAISDDGNTVYVADFEGVVTLDRQGRVLSRFTDPELSGTKGVCIDGCGSVLVCGYLSDNVIQIGPSGNKLGVIANTSHGMSRPLSVCYDRSHSRMIVTTYSNTITVLDLVPT